MKAILYINQFFGQIGGEEFAGHEPEIREGIVGPGMAYAKALKDEVEITHTIICGDNFMGSETDEAIKRILEFLDDKEFDIFFAGPAFRAGRYGAACGHICSAVQKKFGVPAITSMNEENPGVEMYRKEMYIFQGGASAAAMRKDVAKISAFALRLLYGETLYSAEEEGYFGRGVRDQIWLDPPVPATDRVMDMLLKKVNGEAYHSELVIPKSERAPIAPAAANDDPNVVLPLDVLKEYAEEGKIGGVYPYFYATVGTGTTQAEASRMGQEIAEELIEDGVKAVILTST